jgi:hypothetical protein
VGTYTVLGLQDALETAGLCPVEIVELGHGSGQHFIAARKPVVPLGSRAEAGRRPDFVSIMGSKSESGSMVIDRRQMMGYFNMLAAIPGFFLSSLFFMLLWGPISSRLGVSDIDYKTAMLIMITLWIAVAPLAAAGRSKSKKM